jgi:hypothetical protein
MEHVQSVESLEIVHLLPCVQLPLKHTRVNAQVQQIFNAALTSGELAVPMESLVCAATLVQEELVLRDCVLDLREFSVVLVVEVLQLLLGVVLLQLKLKLSREFHLLHRLELTGLLVDKPIEVQDLLSVTKI